MKRKIKLHEIDYQYLLFFVDDELHEINQLDANENLFETICNDLEITIESFRDCWNYSSESHYTIDESYELNSENLYEHPEYVLEWISCNEKRWEKVEQE